MKKLVICFFILPLFLSCDINNWKDTVITNNSDFPVVFKFSNTKEIRLEAKASTTFKPSAYQRIESFSPDKRVKFEYTSANDGSTGEFKNLPSYTVKVINELSETVTLSADGWMDDIENIPNGDQSKNADYQRNIYTENPVFAVHKESVNPVKIIIKREPDKSFLITLQWE